MIDEIKQNLRITDLLARCGITPNRGGFISSPGREEKNPSCKIYPKTDSFYDFSTSRGGDVIDLYSILYGKDRKQALTELYAMIGGRSAGTLPPVPRSIKDKLELDLNKILSDVEKEIYFERYGMTDDQQAAIKAVRLHRLQCNQEVFTSLYSFSDQQGWDFGALAYMSERRKLTTRILRELKCFYIKDYKLTSSYLKGKFSEGQLIRSGLFNEKGNLIFFRHRIVISYLHNGEISYLRGRFYDGHDRENTPADVSKYIGLRDDGLGLNTPKRFYNWDVLRRMAPGQKIYIVEGEFDAMMMTQMGYNCIGVPGTGTVNLDKLDRLSGFEVVIMTDNDLPGKQLQTKLLKRFSELRKQVAIKNLPNKDITDFVVQNGNG